MSSFPEHRIQPEKLQDSWLLPAQFPHKNQLHVRAGEEDAAAGDLCFYLMSLDEDGQGPEHRDTLLLLRPGTGQRAGPHWVGGQPFGAAGGRQGEGTEVDFDLNRKLTTQPFYYLLLGHIYLVVHHGISLGFLLISVVHSTSGGDAASVSEWRTETPCLCDLVNAGRTVGGLPGRSPERSREQSLPLASNQTWGCLHPGTRTGEDGRKTKINLGSSTAVRRRIELLY